MTKMLMDPRNRMNTKVEDIPPTYIRCARRYAKRSERNKVRQMIRHETN